MSKIKDLSLTPEILEVLRKKATERPNTGCYNLYHEEGSYLCRACGRALFRSSTKFSSGSGWPSFDLAIEGSLLEVLDSDGLRKEILCAHCLAHLGHVFHGEGFTARNNRYCVNSLSLDFIKNTSLKDTQEAIVAGGCFWGVEYYLAKLPGVVKTEVGYTGGTLSHPSYTEVCTAKTGHFEALRILYEPTHLSYEALIKYFLEIHDPFQENGQGPDLGPQYRSAVFYYDEGEREIAQSLLRRLELKLNKKPATELLPVGVFWPAEEYHQQYYAKRQGKPYCHLYVKRF